MKPEPIANVDAAILNIEDPTAPDTMGILLQFDGRIDEELLARRIAQSWLHYPRFRQRIRRRPLGRMQWVEDPTFDLSAHLRRVAVPAPGDMAALRRTVGELMGMLLDRSKPLWTMHIIEGGPDGDALLIRVHHAIGDGMTLVRTTLALVRGTPAAPPESEPPFLIDRLLKPISGAVEATQSVSKWVRHRAGTSLRHPERLIGQAERALELGYKFSPLKQDPPTRLTAPLTRRKSIAWTPPVPTLQLKRTARALGVTINDMMLALIAGGLRRYFIALGDRVPKILHASVPVYLGNPSAIELGNNFGLVLAPLPVGEADMHRRLQKVHEAMEKLKRSPEAQIVQTTFNAAGTLPPGLVARMFAEVTRKVSLVVTNVPGPPGTVTVDGLTLTHIVPLVPLSGQVGLGIAIASYNRHIYLGIQVDGDRIPSLPDFIQMLQEEQALLASLTVPTAPKAATAPEAPTPTAERRCIATTRDGTRCRNRPRRGYQSCWVHRAAEPPSKKG